MLAAAFLQTRRNSPDSGGLLAVQLHAVFLLSCFKIMSLFRAVWFKAPARLYHIQNILIIRGKHARDGSAAARARLVQPRPARPARPGGAGPATIWPGTAPPAKRRLSPAAPVSSVPASICLSALS